MSEENKKSETLITEVLDAQETVPEGDSGKSSSGRESAKSGKKGKAEKKKKLTKKEIARRKKEKAEQERLEQLRIQKELEEKRIHEQEQEMERREQERLRQEDDNLKSLRHMRISQSQQIRSEKADKDDWARYVSCNHSTDPNNQADVNTFITQWKETENLDMQQLFSKINEGKELIDQLLQMRSTASVSLNVEEFERLSNQIQEIRMIIENKITLLTHHHLLFSDNYALAKNEVLLSADAAGYSYGLWVNLAKNPRIKEIEFPNVSIEICKYIALASLAIRCTISPFLSEFDKYLLLTPILACEFFQLPAPPKKIGTLMALRQFSQSGQLTPIPYPLKNVNNPQPPLVFKMKFNSENTPDDMESVTVIKIDDIQNTETMISDVEIDKENSVVKFSCQTTGLFALALPKYAHFPFQFWEINSSKSDSLEIFIRTALTELTITIDKDGLCSMESPIQFSRLTAPAALEKLQRHGINIMAPSNNSEFHSINSKLNGKTAELEETLSGGLADASTGFRIRCSKWNSSLPEDRAILLAREIVEFGEPVSDDEQINEEEEEKGEEQAPQSQPLNSSREPSNPTMSSATLPNPNNAANTVNSEEEDKKEAPKTNTKWKCILVKAKHINLIPYAENADEANLKMIKKTQFHQLLYPMMLDIASENVQERVKNCSCFISETVRFLLEKIKLFSSTV